MKGLCVREEEEEEEGEGKRETVVRRKWVRGEEKEEEESDEARWTEGEIAEGSERDREGGGGDGGAVCNGHLGGPAKPNNKSNKTELLFLKGGWGR